MTALSDLLALADSDDDAITWHEDPRDKDPRSEDARQAAFLRDARILCPGVDIFAVPNAGKRTRWEQHKRTREGMRAGALDLVCTWQPTRPGDRGVAFPEFKNGIERPDDNQRDRLRMLVRMGHNTGVFRQERSLLEFLRRCGAPFLVSGSL